MFCFFYFFYFFAVFCGVRAKKRKRKAHIRTFDVSVSLYPWVDVIIADQMASASAPANEIAKQLPASASRLAVPSPAASTAEALDLSAGVAIRGLLLLLLLLLRRVQASSPAEKLNAGVTCINFSFYYRIRLWSTCSCLFPFWSCVAGTSCVRTRTWVKIRFCVRGVLVSLYPAL